MAHRTEGSRYQQTKDLDIKEVAKLVRADIAAEQKAGTLPKDAKFSVKISRYSGGQSMDVRIAYAKPIRVSEEGEELNRAQGMHYPWLTREASVAHARVEALVEAYNYDDSDSQSDYFNVNFYSHVSETGPELVEHTDPRVAEPSAQEAFLQSAGVL